MSLMATANSKQGKKGRSMHPSTQVSSYGLDSTMNLDAVRVQRYKEVRGERKRNTVQRSMAIAASLTRLAKIETSKTSEECRA